MSDLASESGHWYKRDGRPAYTVIGAKGQERSTTLRDARKLDLVPSVTTVTRILASPGLEAWKQVQTILAAMSHPRHPGESQNDFISRVIKDSKEETRRTRERGNLLHGDIERALQGKTHGHGRHIESIASEMKKIGLDFSSGATEHTFCHPLGYGGKIDWNHFYDIGDFKSKDEIEEGKQLAWPEHVLQMAAYANGVGIEKPRCFNVFVGVKDAKVVIHEWSPEELEGGLEKFLLLLRIWQIDKKYDTRRKTV